MSAIQPPWEAFAYKGILVVQVLDMHDAKRKILLTIAALKSIEHWRKVGFTLMRRFLCFNTTHNAKELGTRPHPRQVKRRRSSQDKLFSFSFFVAAVYWANLKGAFMTCTARNAPNPQIPRTDKEKNSPQKKHCVSSPGVEDFWEPSAATYHFLKRCSTRVGFSSSFQRVL